MNPESEHHAASPKFRPVLRCEISAMYALLVEKLPPMTRDESDRGNNQPSDGANPV